jgi:biopolymer transport protein ExbB/TolQ
MTRPRGYLLRMLVFLIAVGAGAWLLRVELIRIFHNNPPLNGAILAVLVLGILYIVRQVWMLDPEVRWLDSFQREEMPTSDGSDLRLLAPMATMLRERTDRRLALSPVAMRSMLEGIGARLDESRETSRYAIGLLIFLGLLGTFWGLLETVTSVGEAIANLQVTGGDPAQMFARLKAGIEGPLKGMGSAFGASLFGLSGSLVLGFLELQAGQANNRFFRELEDWLSTHTRVSSGALSVEGDATIPAYVEALLEQSAENIDKLQRTLLRSEENRENSAAGVTQLIERLSTLSETLRQQQQLLARLAENAVELRGLTTKLAEQSLAQGADDPTRGHLRNLESYLARLLEETVRGRTALADELRGEFKLLARTLASSRGAAQQPLPLAPPAPAPTPTPAAADARPSGVRPLTAGERLVPPGNKS